MLRPFYVFNSKYCEVTYNRWAQIFPEITHLAPECNEKKKDHYGEFLLLKLR